jgi:hypothetical protein
LLAKGAVAVALAASVAWASSPTAASPSVLGGAPILSPEAALSFGDLGSTSPLLAVFNDAWGGRDPAFNVASLTEPKFDLAASAQRAPAPEPAAQDAPSPVVYDPAAGPPLSPMQSALQAAMARLIARNDSRNPLGGGDWRAARMGVAAFYAARAYAPVWVGSDGLTEAGRAALSQLSQARDDGLDLSAFELPREMGRGLSPDTLAEAEATIASAVVAYAEQATGSRVPPSRVSPLIFSARSVADPGAALAEVARRPIPLGGSRTSIRRRKAIASCAKS